MIQQRMNEWILHPESLNTDSLQELRIILERYPYFQTAWILYLKNLFQMHDESFQTELRRGALYVADLSVLFYYIEGDKFVIQKHTAEHSSTETADRTLDLIERFLSESPEPSPNQVEIPLSMEVNLDYTSVLLEDTQMNATAVETPPLRGQNLIDSFIARDCSGKVMVAEGKVNRTEPVESVPISFVENDLSAKDEDVALEIDQQDSDVSLETGEDESYFTETLAKIYIKQQRYDKVLKN